MRICGSAPQVGDLWPAAAPPPTFYTYDSDPADPMAAFHVTQPHLASWAAVDAPLRLIEQTAARTDPDPKALACYGLLARHWDDVGERQEAMLLRFVDGRPVSAMTTQFLAWCCDRLAAQEGVS